MGLPPPPATDGGSSAGVSEEGKRLYVTNLPKGLNEAEFRKVFELYGPVTDAFVHQAKAEGGEYCSGFISFENADDATGAMLVLGGMYKFIENGRTIEVSVARPRNAPPRERQSGGADASSAGQSPAFPPPPPTDGKSALPPPPTPPRWPGAAAAPGPPPPPGGDRWGKSDGGGGFGNEGNTPKLWIGNLPRAASEDQVRQIFSAYGQVTEVRLLPVRSQTGQACAFLHYSSAREADNCLEAMRNGYEIEPGVSLKVKRPDDHKGGKSGGKGGDKGFRPY
eukprot:TRINITY_DN24381_c0_g1_i2.p1 TRINITY_DN24381_c0_g1~~TRINITY_DN24381_c0_g1_i2.p1  ORF type:complete len:280 (-),score=52.02 TRINITY_DN24381_c0_g1_i2:41-880(-)